MAEVIHRYVGKSGKPPPGPSKEERRQKEAKGKLDVEFVAEKTEQVRIRRMQTEMAVAKAPRAGRKITRRKTSRVSVRGLAAEDPFDAADLLSASAWHQ